MLYRDLESEDTTQFDLCQQGTVAFIVLAVRHRVCSTKKACSGLNRGVILGMQSQGVTEQQAIFTLTKCILAFKVWTERMVSSLCVWSLLGPSSQTSTACYSFTINIRVLEPSTRWQDTRSAVTVISQIEIVALQACTEKQELPFPKARPIRKVNF